MNVIALDGDYVFVAQPEPSPASIQYLPPRSLLLPSVSIETNQEEKEMEFQIYRSENRTIIAPQAIIAAEERVEALRFDDGTKEERFYVHLHTAGGLFVVADPQRMVLDRIKLHWRSLEGKAAE